MPEQSSRAYSPCEGHPSTSVVLLNGILTWRLCLQQVRLIEFSPCEQYLITYSSIEPSNPREKAKVLLNVFDTKTGKKLRAFDNSVDEFAIGTAAGPGGALRWPVFKWAGGPKDM